MLNDKNKLKRRSWNWDGSLRFFVAPIFAACLLAWLTMPAYPVETKQQSIAPKQVASPPSITTNELQELKKLMDELHTRERENHTLLLEGQRKMVDWWIGFLTVITAILAISGALIPYLIGRKDKKIIEQDKLEIKRMLEEIKKMSGEALANVDKIRERKIEADQHVEDLKTYKSGQPPDGETKEIDKTVATVQQDPTSSPLLRLRAEAIAASQANQADTAYALWRALIELDPTNANAHFNAGYWASMLGEASQGSELLRWAKQAGQHYAQALNIKPDMHEATNNWGNALAAEAKAIAANDLGAARTLWQRAGEKYQQALSIKPDKHEAAYNWGNALAAEAKAIAANDLEAARTLWQRAGEKYQQALSIKPDLHETATNWGSALDDEAKAIAANDLGAARTLWQRAGEKYQQALSIKADLHEAANNWGIALAAEAKAIAANDLGAARTLWQRAGEKYQRALSIKPDKHETANNWAYTLLREHGSLSPNGDAGTQALLNRAEQLLMQHVEAAPGKVAYNLACVFGRRGDAATCLKWLKVSQTHKTLPDCEHLKTDTDLDLVRVDPEIAKWLQTVCP